MSTFSMIAVHDEGESVSLVLRRPPLNVMNIAMMQEINAALEQLLRHPAAKVLLIRAEGKAFSAGVDIADHTAEKVGVMMKEFHKIFEILNQVAIPVVAAARFRNSRRLYSDIPDLWGRNTCRNSPWRKLPACGRSGHRAASQAGSLRHFLKRC